MGRLVERPCSLLSSQLVGRNRNEPPRLDDWTSVGVEFVPVLTSESRTVHHILCVQINHPATVGPSADESCISCRDTYLYSTVFHPQQAKTYMLLRNTGAFIGQAVSPL